MIRNIDYEKITKNQNIYVVCEMDMDYNICVKRFEEANKTSNTYSVAKTFTSTAIGICYDMGLLKISDKFLDIMEIEDNRYNDPKWENVTIDMLLRHDVGFESMTLDIDCDDVLSYGTKDYLQYVLSFTLPKQGLEVVYTDAAYYLLSLVVEKVTGKTLFDFLRPYLMDIMDFREYAWSSCPAGHTMGATGLYIRCEDMVKLGIVYLNKGIYKNQRVISQEWCSLVLEKGYALYDYGEGWYVKGGILGQFLAINKNAKIAAAWMGCSRTIDNLVMLGLKEVE